MRDVPVAGGVTLDPGPLPVTSKVLTGSVHSYDLSVGVDGPGTRFVVFMAGCPLRCQYCHSPDTWWMRSGERHDVDHVLRRVARYRRFIQVAGGGFTVSGGEPLLQARFTRALLRGAKEMGLSTALDTSGFLGARADDGLLDATDLVLLDIKSFDPDVYYKVSGGREVEPTLDFARRLADRGTPMWVRFVLVPGITDEPSNVDGLARFVAGLPTVQRVEVLPFHRLGEHKYTELDLDFPLANVLPPGTEQVRRVRHQFRRYGLTVN